MKYKGKNRRDSELVALKRVIELVASAKWKSLVQLSLTFQADKRLLTTERGSYVFFLATRLSALMPAPSSQHFINAQISLEPNVVLLVEIAVHRLDLARRFLISGNVEEATQNLLSIGKLIITSAMASGFTLPPKLVNKLSALPQHLLLKLQAQTELKSFISMGRISRRIVFVLGMHRSGTSALTGLLCLAGLIPPNDQMPLTDANPKGYWESVSLYSHNEAFLQSLGAAWHDPDLLPPGWQESPATRVWRSRLLEIIASVYDPSGVPIIKDPRFCLLVDALEPWFESQDVEISFLLPIRHPHEVAKSLSLREGLSIQQSLHLWMIYTSTSMAAVRSHPHRILPFDHLISSSDLVVTTCQEVIGAQLVTSASNGFIDSKHRHQMSAELGHDFCELAPKDKIEEEFTTLLFATLSQSLYLDKSIWKQVSVILKDWKRHARH